MRICGIDQSMKSSGQVVMDLNDDTLDIEGIHFYGYTTVKCYGIHEGNVDIEYIGQYDEYRAKSMPERQSIAYSILERNLDGVSYVGMEDYAVSKTKQNSGSILQIAEFNGGVRYMLYNMGIGIMNFGIMQVKRFATGDGHADKAPMCESFKMLYPDLYPADAFAKLREYESPHNDLCDAFWMCEVLRCCMKVEKLGPESIPADQFAFLTTTQTKGALSLIEAPLIKKGVPYEPVRKKKRAKKKLQKKS